MPYEFRNLASASHETLTLVLWGVWASAVMVGVFAHGFSTGGIRARSGSQARGRRGRKAVEGAGAGNGAGELGSRFRSDSCSSHAYRWPR